MPALRLYRENFTPSEALAEPYAMVGAPRWPPRTSAEARRQALTVALAMLRMRSGASLPGAVTGGGGGLPVHAEEREFVDSWLDNVPTAPPGSSREGLDGLVEAAPAPTNSCHLQRAHTAKPGYAPTG